METMEKRKPSFGYALFIVAVIFGLVILGNAKLGLKLQVLFVLAWLIAFPLCMRIGYKYKELENGLYEFMRKGILSVTFMIVIGMMSGAWNASGTVATITWFGLGILNPGFYQATSFIICFLFSLITGTSWGTAGTVGIALMGVGMGVGLDPVAAAIPIISAAFIGDMTSPLSDTPNIIAGAANVNVMDHCRHQLKLVIPSVVIVTIIFFFQGLNQQLVSTVGDVEILRNAIAENYNLGIVTLIPLVIVVVCLVCKIPSIPSILCGAVSAGLITIVYQGESLSTVVSSMWSGFVMDSGNEMVDKLFSRGGMSSMSGTAFLVLICLGLFGILTTASVFEVLLYPLTSKVKNGISATIVSFLMAFLVNLGGTTSFSCIFTGEIMSKIYEERKLNVLDLTSAISVGSLLFCLLIPWHTNPIPPATYLGVELSDIVPHMFMPFVFLAVLIVNAVISEKKRKKAAKE